MWQKIVDWLVYSLIGLSSTSKSGSAINFFIYDTVKILFLLTFIIFVIAILRSYFPAEKTKKILSHKREYIGNVIAAALGIVTPF